MLAITSSTRFFFYQHAVSMHKGFEGLSGIVEEAFPKELFTGAFFIFLNRRRDHMKILCWDNDGLAIWYKRLEKGVFDKKSISENQMTRKEFLMLLEGVTPKKIQPRFSL
ncbi:MAG: IS66 family insertion sequence element accessory protein TnpB [Chlamydiota bacterium]